MLKTSIIIPAHNEENYILNTIESINNQTNQDYELIVVTNGCTDNTQLILQNLNHPKIKLLNLKTANVSRARNYGASNAEGELLLFLDADTLLEPNTIDTINNNFSTNLSVATTKVKPDTLQTKYRFAMWFKNFYNSNNFYKGCSGALICRREHFDLVNGYDPETIVKEHRVLTKKLLQHGKYTCFDTYVTTSMRRFNQWGLTKATIFWAKQLIKAKTSNLKDSKYEIVR